VYVTVLTPTYNRANTLPRTFEGLLHQTFRDFEWLIIDDGSSDGTDALVKDMIARAPFPVRYQWQRNEGKHMAVNNGVRMATGEFLVIVDSDDWLLADGLHTLCSAWHTIPEPRNYAEVRALCVDPTGNLAGGTFPSHPFDSDSFDLRFKHGITGDSVGMWRTDVLREFPFPDGFSGTLVLESLIYHRIATKYKTRGINAVVGGKEYQQDGLSATNPKRVLEQAGALRLYNKEIVHMRRPLPIWLSLRTYILWLRFSMISRASLIGEMRDAPDRRLFVVALPVAAMLASRDLLRARMRRQQRHAIRA
jgi:glycosyltransferase involved in cell wall biosynthesis